jgi:hypothetical protein
MLPEEQEPFPEHCAGRLLLLVEMAGESQTPTPSKGLLAAAVLPELLLEMAETLAAAALPVTTCR